MSVRARLERLERLGLREARQLRSPEHVYERIRREAMESVGESLAAGEEPIYRIAENEDVLAADGRIVNPCGDFVGVLDDHIRALDAHIAEIEREKAVIEDRQEREH